MQNHPTVMSIAGSDSGGGAGIQADIKTINALGGYGTCAITALTAQNGLTVTGIAPTDPDFVRLQIETIEKGFPVQAAKTGMLFSVPIIEAVAHSLAHAEYPLVVDPVCVSQSGVRLLEDSAIASLANSLFPLATLITPNIPEAELLAEHTITDEEDILFCGEKLLARVKGAVLIKGGHRLQDDSVTDILFQKDAAPQRLTNPRVRTENTHGTGCTLSAAIATGLAFKKDLVCAIKDAQNYLNHALAASYTPGAGAGPVNHLWNASV
ncbi:MAG: bifunctional hydroxymethylpyrimidine kinase/phosphomethylpyrimidine kinase [Desulfovibrionaceae bacterium]|nr:bifunctional hydroxymethylpyrimidine kinase/phosphomethylpyrimidine kinase [Desulfovibrionaceae bacterium]